MWLLFIFFLILFLLKCKYIKTPSISLRRNKIGYLSHGCRCGIAIIVWLLPVALVNNNGARALFGLSTQTPALFIDRTHDNIAHHYDQKLNLF